MNFRNLSAWCIKNPVVPLVLFAGLLLMGIVAFVEMKVQDQPDIDFPVVNIDIAQPGAAPSEAVSQITQKVEAAVRNIPGVSEIHSATSEGDSQTTVVFNLGEDINAAVSEVKNSVDQIRGQLPQGIIEPQIYKEASSTRPIAFYSVSADDMTPEQLSWFVDDTVSRRLLSIDGMAKIQRSGGVDREIEVILDPARMQSFGLTAPQVNEALRQLNLNAAGGRADIGGTRQSVRVLANAVDAYALSQTDIPLGAGRTVKLADIASVTDSHGEVRSIARSNGRDVVIIGLSRAKGASDVAVYDAALAEMAKLEKENPGVHFQKNFASVDYTRQQYESSMSAMVEGAVLAVVVVILFLRDWRATVVSAIAIPLSAIPSFWFMKALFGFTLNFMSLMALGLVAGVLVDDAIVEIENIVRHMRMGKSAYRAAIDAADEIGLAVVATTFSIVAVFLPVGLMPGVSGQFFKNFGFTVVISVLMSLAVARMITPMIAAYFLKAKGHAEHANAPWIAAYIRVLRWSLDSSGAEAYRRRRAALGRRIGIATRLLARLRDHRVWMIGVALAALVATGFVFAALPQEFFPNTDDDWSAVHIDLPPGTTIADTRRVTDQVADFLGQQHDVASSVEDIAEGRADIYITMRADRRMKTNAFQRAMAPKLQQFPDARVSFQSDDGGATGRAISVLLRSSDPQLLDQTAATLVEQMKTLKTVVAPRIEGDLRRPEVVIRPRLDLAANLGVTTAALSDTIRIATLGEIDQDAAKFSLTTRQVPIRVRLPEAARTDMTTLDNLPVQTAAGGSVPLSRVADITFGAGPTSIQRYNQERRIFVSADLAPGVVKGTADKQIQNLPIMQHLPNGVSNAPFGQDKWQAEMIRNFAIAVLAGVMLVFSVLVLLYHRVISPLVNMASLSLAPLGGLIALWITGQAVSLIVYIGILMLLGIVAKNSILLIDFAIEEMKRGASKFDAIVEAGHKRAQPIVMTTVAMIAGMLPTALSLSGDGAWRGPMGTVVIGGLIVSTALTLLIVPAAFSLADGIEKRVGPMFSRRLLTYRPGAPDQVGAVLPAE